MPALSRPDTIAGPLTAADLDAARQHSTGNVLHLHRAVFMPAGLDQQGKQHTRRFGKQADFVNTIPTDMGAFDDGAAVEGGKHRDPVESMLQHRRMSTSVRYGLTLAALLAVAGFASRALWPMAGA